MIKTSADATRFWCGSYGHAAVSRTLISNVGAQAVMPGRDSGRTGNERPGKVNVLDPVRCRVISRPSLGPPSQWKPDVATLRRGSTATTTVASPSRRCSSRSPERRHMPTMLHLREYEVVFAYLLESARALFRPLVEARPGHVVHVSFGESVGRSDFCGKSDARLSQCPRSCCQRARIKSRQHRVQK